MGRFKVGDIVARKSYGLDILFKVVDVKSDEKEDTVTLKGIAYRIEADAPESDLIIQNDQRIREYNMRSDRVVEQKSRQLETGSKTRGLKKALFRSTSKDENGFSQPGKVLHLDGDESYLKYCLDKYEEFGIQAIGRHIPEKEQPSKVYRLLGEIRPDILVLTGHDGFIKGHKDFMNLGSYRNSRYFAEAVREARRYENSLDSLVIFAGACQSMYTEIINAGANFASAPRRVLIHALDPVFVGRKVAFTGIDNILEPKKVIGETITGKDGIGGVQTRGKYRDGYPGEACCE